LNAYIYRDVFFEKTLHHFFSLTGTENKTGQPDKPAAPQKLKL
jgi:hypothetical protein